MEALKNRKFTKDERNCIKKWMEETPEDRSIIMSEKNGDTVNKFELQCLKANTRVNDAVINFYLRQCLQQSSENCLILSTHFYRKLMDEMSNDPQLRGKYNYENVIRWIDIDIFSMDKIFIPINEDNVHWILVVVDNKNRVIQHYDSLHKQIEKKGESKEGPKEYYTMEESYDLEAVWNKSRKKKLETVLQYLNDKHLTTHGINLTSDWKTECVMAPVQPNCKIVMIKL